MVRLLALCTCLFTTMIATAAQIEPTENKLERVRGVGLEQTRVLIEKGARSTMFGIANETSRAILVSAWVNDLDGKPSELFEVSPNMFQVDANSNGRGKIMLLDKLPQDRESVFWLVVNSASPSNKNVNSLGIALAQRIKLFYRPEQITESCRYAAEHLKWTLKGGLLKVENPTPITVSVSDLTSGSRSQRLAEMVLPFTSKEWKLDFSLREDAQFSYVDEWGGFNNVPLKLTK